MNYVYIIKSLKDGSQYVGMSESPIDRLRQHNRGRVRSTRIKKPWKIIHIEVFPNRKSARQREKYLKTSAGRRYRNTFTGD